MKFDEAKNTFISLYEEGYISKKLLETILEEMVGETPPSRVTDNVIPDYIFINEIINHVSQFQGLEYAIVKDNKVFIQFKTFLPLAIFKNHPNGKTSIAAEFENYILSLRQDYMISDGIKDCTGVAVCLCFDTYRKTLSLIPSNINAISYVARNSFKKSRDALKIVNLSNEDLATLTRYIILIEDTYNKLYKIPVTVSIIDKNIINIQSDGFYNYETGMTNFNKAIGHILGPDVTLKCTNGDILYFHKYFPYSINLNISTQEYTISIIK